MTQVCWWRWGYVSPSELNIRNATTCKVRGRSPRGIPPRARSDGWGLRPTGPRGSGAWRSRPGVRRGLSLRGGTGDLAWEVACGLLGRRFSLAGIAPFHGRTARASGRRSRCIEITCPRWRRAQHYGLIVHELKDLCFERDVTIVDGIPTASVPLTLLGLSAVRPAVVALALERALRRNFTTLTELDEMMERLGGRGRRGARRLRTVLAARPRDLRPSDSDMETLLFAALRWAGVALSQRQVLVHHRGKFVGQIDGGWPDARVGYEYDSDESHTGRVATAADSARRHRLTAAGWLVVTVVNSDLRSGATLACAALDELLRQRAPRLASKTDR